MKYYYKRTDTFENMSYSEATLYFQKTTECYLQSIQTLTSITSKSTNLNKKNIGRFIALSKMLNKNYVMCKSDPEYVDGSLIQSWISLGAILEACLQSFLELYSEAYNKNPYTYSYINKKGKEIVVVVKEIEKLKAKQLINYFFSGDGLIQANEFNKGEIDNVRINRNLIHLFAGEMTADWEQLNKSIKLVIEVILDLISRLPEIPDEYGYVKLCDDNLYDEVIKMKRKWFVLKR